MDRREFVKGTAVAAAGGALLGPSFWRTSFAGAPPGAGPYGALGVADANGIQLPPGFSSTLIATAGAAVPGAASGYVWHPAPDGGSCFTVPGGGWVYTSNSEVGGNGGGAGAVKFNAAGGVVDAYRILSNTSVNCAGGLTPWGTWLSCEEVVTGHVWECNPQGAGQGTERPLMGTFKHEAAAVDTATGIVYLTEDDGDSRIYRFTPTTYGDLSGGQLHALKIVSGDPLAGPVDVTWVSVPTNAPAPRDASTSSFKRGEGMWWGAGVVFFTTTTDNRVWKLTPASNKLEVAYDQVRDGGELRSPDNLTVHKPSNDLFVGEDGDNLELIVIAKVGGVEQSSAFLRLVGHAGSEVTGVAFNPQGTKLYFSSQRGTGDGIGRTYAISGPFRVGGSLTEETLIAAGSTWRYLDDGSNQGAAWTARTFNDASWKVGAAPLGYGDPVATTVGFGPDANNKFITTYFRRAFTATNGLSTATLRLRRDDGAVVYINGTEVARSNMPAGAVNSSTLASTVVGGAEELRYFEIAITPTLFSGGGANVIAVEIHQQSVTSSDLVFDLELVGTGNTGALPSAQPIGASQFTPLAPSRLLDTRTGGFPGGKPGAGDTVELQVTGGSIPANATAVVLNITGTEATANGFLTVFPTGETRPLAANQNLVTGQTRGNLVTVKVGAGGKVSIYTQSGTHLVADVNGFYAAPTSAGGRFTPLAPARLLDSRKTSKLAAGGTVDVQVTGAGNLPNAGVSSVVVNITITEPDGPGFVTGYAAGAARPTTSSVNNDRAGQTIGNLAILPLGSGGKITLYTFAATNVIVDVAGWFSDGTGVGTDKGLYVPLTPTRVLDTRDAPNTRVMPGGSLDLQVANVGGVPSSGAAGVLMNLTMVEATGPGFVTAYPTGQTRDEVSSVYADLAGMTIPSLVAAQLGSGGKVTLFSNAGTHLVADLAGWYTT